MEMDDRTLMRKLEIDRSHGRRTARVNVWH